MKVSRLIVGALALLALTSCGASRHTSSDVNLSAIREFAYIQPYSVIFCYGDDGKGRYDEGDTKKNARLIMDVIESERFPFSDMIKADYDNENADIERWLRSFENVDGSKYDRLRVPKSLRKMIDASGLRYAVVIYSYGYTQTKAGYQREKVEKAAGKVIDKAVEKLTGISGLTNPSQNYSVSSPYGNKMYCAVIDGQTDRVVHFVEEVPTFASHPTESGYVSELLHNLLKEFIR